MRKELLTMNQFSEHTGGKHSRWFFSPSRLIYNFILFFPQKISQGTPTSNWPVSVCTPHEQLFQWLLLFHFLQAVCPLWPLALDIKKWFSFKQVYTLDSFCFEACGKKNPVGKWFVNYPDQPVRYQTSHAKPLKSPLFPILIAGFELQQVALTTSTRLNVGKPFLLTGN